MVEVLLRRIISGIALDDVMSELDESQKSHYGVCISMTSKQYYHLQP